MELQTAIFFPKFSLFELGITEIATSALLDPSDLSGQYENKKQSLPLSRCPTSFLDRKLIAHPKTCRSLSRPK